MNILEKVCEIDMVGKKDSMLHIRISAEDLEAIKLAAKDKGFDSYSEYCLSVLRTALGRDDEGTTREIVESLLKRVASLEQKIAA